MEFKTIGIEALKAAISRNPQRVLDAVGVFLARGIASLNRYIIRDPWKMGSSGGGAPVASGNLRDMHTRTFEKWQAKITNVAPYAKFVHDGTSRMKARPWLDYSMKSAREEINQLAGQMVDTIANGLAE